MKKPIYFKNLLKVIKGYITGKSMGGITSLYDTRYPPTKFLRYHRSKIYIHCIMCGFPRAGTHWILNVVKKSTDQKTGELRGNSKPLPSDKKVILLKIHARNKLVARVKALWLLPPFNFGGKYIYVYRDPRDSIISLYEMYKKLKEYDNLEPDEFLNIYDPITQYRWEINAWVLRNHKNVFLVKYESLKLSPVEGFNRIFKFLGLDIQAAGEFIEEMVATSDSKKRPRGTAYGWKRAPIEYKFIIDEVSRRLAKEIKRIRQS